MRKSRFGFVIGLISAVAALTAAAVAFLIIKDKQRKDEQALEDYLDGSIL